MKNKYLNFIAMAISFLGSPFIVIASMLIFLAWHYKDGVLQFYSYLLVTAIFVLIIPIAYMIENIPRLKFIDLHLTNKEDREKVLLVTAFSVLVGYLMLSFIGIPKHLLLIELVMLMNLIIISILTFRMKLSIHLVVLNIASTLVVFFLGYLYLWLYLLLLPLSWSRYYREKHSLPEIFVGISLSFIVTLIIMKMFTIAG